MLAGMLEHQIPDGHRAITPARTPGSDIMKITTALASAVFMATTLAGGGSSAYCDSVKKANTDFKTVNNGDFEQMDKAFDRMQDLADKAPSEIEKEWKILDGAITDMRKALNEAGISFADLGKIQAGKMTKLASEMQKVGSEEFQDAATKIEKHAKSECEVDLGGTA